MQDAVRAYLELALGLTEASRKRAEKVARDLLGRGGATAAQLQSMVDELVSTSRTNREGLARLVRYEVERALGAVGLATAEEVADLTARVRALERELRANRAGGPAAPAAPEPAAEQAGVRKATAKKSTAKKATAKKSTAKQATAKKDTAKKATAKKATAKKTTARKAAIPAAAGRSTG